MKRNQQNRILRELTAGLWRHSRNAVLTLAMKMANILSLLTYLVFTLLKPHLFTSHLWFIPLSLHDMGPLTVWHLAEHIYLQIFILCYVTLQNILSLVFAPTPPPPKEAAKLHRPRIAIIGAGLTGISAASHCVGHGCDVKIFESRSKEKGLGGIWSVSLLQPLTYCHVDTNLRSASIRRQHCRCTVSCTAFTPQ